MNKCFAVKLILHVVFLFFILNAIQAQAKGDTIFVVVYIGQTKSDPENKVVLSAEKISLNEDMSDIDVIARVQQSPFCQNAPLACSKVKDHFFTHFSGDQHALRKHTVRTLLIDAGGEWEDSDPPSLTIDGDNNETITTEEVPVFVQKGKLYPVIPLPTEKGEVIVTGEITPKVPVTTHMKFPDQGHMVIGINNYIHGLRIFPNEARSFESQKIGRTIKTPTMYYITESQGRKYPSASSEIKSIPLLSSSKEAIRKNEYAVSPSKIPSSSSTAKSINDLLNRVIIHPKKGKQLINGEKNQLQVVFPANFNMENLTVYVYEQILNGSSYNCYSYVDSKTGEITVQPSISSQDEKWVDFKLWRKTGLLRSEEVDAKIPSSYVHDKSLSSGSTLPQFIEHHGRYLSLQVTPKSYKGSRIPRNQHHLYKSGHERKEQLEKDLAVLSSQLQQLEQEHTKTLEEMKGLSEKSELQMHENAELTKKISSMSVNDETATLKSDHNAIAKLKLELKSKQEEISSLQEQLKENGINQNIKEDFDAESETETITCNLNLTARTKCTHSVTSADELYNHIITIHGANKFKTAKSGLITCLFCKQDIVTMDDDNGSGFDHEKMMSHIFKCNKIPGKR